MENFRKRINFEVVSSRKVALKRIAKPSFKRAKIFREDLVGVHMAKPLGSLFSTFRNISCLIFFIIRG